MKPALAPHTLTHLERFSSAERTSIDAAAHFAKTAHAGQYRVAGPEAYTHLVAVAQLLIDEFNADADTIIAGLLHDSVEDTPVTLEEIEAQFGATVRFIVDGCTDVGRGDGRAALPTAQERMPVTREKIAEYGKKDSRVFLVKLADRWHNLLTSQALRSKSQRRLSEEALEFHVPICRELGFMEQADAIEDAARYMLDYLDRSQSL